ncbi:MAG: DMT family transporter [Candidatus Woesearchaeota archaeon]
MNWFIAALFAGLFFASSRIISRFALRKNGNPLAYTALHDLTAGLILIPFLLFDFTFPSQVIPWIFFGITTFFLFLTDYLTFKSIQLIDISLYQILIQVRHIVVLFGGLLLFSEQITLPKMFAILLIILGAIIALYKKSKFDWSKGIVYAILAGLCASIAFLASKTALNGFSNTTFASFVLIGIGLISFAFMKFDDKKIIYEFKINSWKILIAAVLFGGFELLQFLAIKIGEVSKAIPVIQISLVFAVIGGIVLLKEYDRLIQKIIGMILIIAGIIIMNIL